MNNDVAPKPLDIATIVEKLRSTGLAGSALTCEQSDHGCLIRAKGGLVLHIRKDGKLLITGKHSTILRRALGFAGRPATCLSSPEEIKAAGVILVSGNGDDAGSRKAGPEQDGK
ncbi:MAG: hypothetical protein ACR652_03880 [Methylocystis sp.]|uniref:hypothetical protein n=1 Tax=Methylocystis sp. TaxID=1911079 RepID=UPI003DA5BCA1